MHLLLVPEHVLELVLDQLRVSDCAACCCTSTELRTLSQASCKPIAYLRLPIRVDLCIRCSTGTRVASLGRLGSDNSQMGTNCIAVN